MDTATLPHSTLLMMSRRINNVPCTLFERYRVPMASASSNTTSLKPFISEAVTCVEFDL